jgi:LAO/AO transport system kinase
MAASSQLLARVQAGDPLSLSRLCRRLEEGVADPAQVEALYGHPRAHVIGVTGSPGAGKSTLVSRLITAFRRRGERVGVVAVDPTSPFTGGAVLGDRIRMQEHTEDSEVFVRSLATRGLSGGLSPATEEVVLALSLWGAGLVLVETVGVGQAELDVMDLADTLLVVVAPGMGDDVQAAKAGILEVADLLVVNKSDRPEAARTVAELQTMLALGKVTSSSATVAGHRPSATLDSAGQGDGSWSIELHACAAEDGTGVTELVTALLRHRAWLDTAPGKERRLQRAERRVRRRLERVLVGAFEEVHAGLLTSLSRQVSSGGVTLAAASARVRDCVATEPGAEEA